MSSRVSVPASYLILRKENKILLMLRKNTGYYDDWYTIPSGHVEEGERPIDGLIRETKEEIGIELDRFNIKFVHAMYRVKHDPTGARADYFFEVTEWQGEPQNTEPEKCVEIGWFDVDALPVNLMHHVRDALDGIRMNSAYTELGLDRIVKNPNA